MKFIYLLCLSFTIFSYVKADEQYGFNKFEEFDSFHPREYYQVASPDKKPPVVPPYPIDESEVSTVPSFKVKFLQVKQKLEKEFKDRIAYFRPKKEVKPKSTTPEPFVVYERVKVHKKTDKKVKPMSKDCKLISKALFG
uniref:Uncharacterized protein n=1 Tax=Tetranychus urticae TaxID=32264 RepID=T1JYJ4_TETUR